MESARGSSDTTEEAVEARKVHEATEERAAHEATEERKAHESVKDRARKVNEAAPRYQPVAYSVADVVPPDVPAVGCPRCGP